MRILFLAMWFGAVTTAWACTPDLPAVQGRKPQIIESKKYALAYRTQPEKVVIGQHFVVELALCAKEGAAAPESVRVDAFMPEHRHGMNYKTVVTSTGAGKYRAEGLMFHMPGRWEYIFEVRAAGATERVTASVALQ
jgi:hypothetical protein